MGGRAEKQNRQGDKMGGLHMPPASHSSPTATLQSDLLEGILSDQTFRRNQDWGEVRAGHPEGTLRAHVKLLNSSFDTLLNSFPRLHEILGEEGILKVRILIAAHDSMKPDARRGVPTQHPQNHASLAASFLKELGATHDLVVMTQLHDEPYALYRQEARSEVHNARRLDKLLACVSDWDVFFTFQVCDKVGPGRDIESIRWLSDKLQQSYVELRVPAAEMISCLLATYDMMKEEKMDPAVKKDQPEKLVIDLKSIPSVADIRNISSRADFVFWAGRFAQEVRERPERFPGASPETVKVIDKMRAFAEERVEAICANTGIMDAQSIDWRSIAFVLRGSVQG